jgi:hypothetical protein
MLVYEYPYKDPATQNYIYEIPTVAVPLKENERVIINLAQSVNSQDVRIPLSYISPRLEGYLVRRKVGDNIQDVYVKL